MPVSETTLTQATNLLLNCLKFDYVDLKIKYFYQFIIHCILDITTLYKFSKVFFRLN